MSAASVEGGEFRLLAPRFRKVEKFFEEGVVRHGGTRYRRGDLLDLSEEDAERLLRVGAVQRATDTPPWEVVEPEFEPEEEGGDEDSTETPTTPEAAQDPENAPSPEPVPEAPVPPTESPETEENEEPPAEPVDYSTWDYSDLREEASKRGLDTSGKKPEIASRLAAHDQASKVASDD